VLVISRLCENIELQGAAKVTVMTVAIMPPNLLCRHALFIGDAVSAPRVDPFSNTKHKIVGSKTLHRLTERFEEAGAIALITKIAGCGLPREH
jgi:hypothetical protein